MKTLAVGLCAAAALAAGLGSAGGATNARVLALPAAVGWISADGGRVAFHEAARGKKSCDSVSIWTPATGAVAPLGGDPCSSPYRFQDLKLAGTTALWWDYDTGNHVYCDDVYAASLARPKAVGLGLCDGSEGDTYYEFAGDATVAAVVDYSLCESDCVGPNGDLLPDGNYGVEVARVVGGKARSVLKAVDFRDFLDARSWRVATIEPKAVLTVYDLSGKRLWSVPGVKGVTGGWISGISVVIRRGPTLQAYSPHGTGAVRTLPRGADVDGVAGGLVLYTVGSTLRLLRLSDGHDGRVASVKGLADAQVTPAGVYYAAHSSVTFVPLAAALQGLS